MFERFTADARAVVVAAHEGCRDHDDAEIGPVHLLRALAGLDAPVAEVLAGHGVDAAAVDRALAGDTGGRGEPARPPLGDDDAEALRALGIDLDAIRKAVEASFGEGALDQPALVGDVPTGDAAQSRGRRRARLGGRTPFSAGAKKSLELSLREAIRSRSGDIRAEHLALGVLRCDDVVVRRVLWQLNVDPRALRSDLEDRLRRSA